MNIAMKLTMDGLLRSLRSIAHGVADRVEVRPPKRAAMPAARRDRKERADERSR